MKEITRTKFLLPKKGFFCSGCLHATAAKLMGECLEELGVLDRSLLVIGVGCHSLVASTCDVDVLDAPHGRASACATALKRCQPDSIVFTYQGDGDAAAIGLSETIYAASRGAKITVIFANNGTYGMTGGQLAPTTLIGQTSSTTPGGRVAETDGYPLDMCAMLNTLKAPSYIARCTLNSPKSIMKAKACIKKAFQNQIDGKPFSFVELVTTCPSNLHMDPVESLKYIEDERLPVFPLGVFRDEEMVK